MCNHDNSMEHIGSNIAYLHKLTHISVSGGNEIVIHTEENIDPSISSMVRHHFHLHHGDFVRVDVTSTNKADSTTSVTSDGLKIDLTEPKMSELVDGRDLANDMQYTVFIIVMYINCCSVTIAQT